MLYLTTPKVLHVSKFSLPKNSSYKKYIIFVVVAANENFHTENFPNYGGNTDINYYTSSAPLTFGLGGLQMQVTL